MKLGVKIAAGFLAFLLLLFGSLMSYLSFTPSSGLPEELRQLQQEMGFAQVGGAGWFRPCEYLALTSKFGWRINPITGEAGNFHNGVDLANDESTPVYAAKNGTVVQVSGTGGYGNHVRLDHGDGFTTLYAHLQRYIVSEGETVSGGQLIGYMGSTGNSTGPHLHFSVFNGSEYVDPMIYISAAALSKDAVQRQIYTYLTTQMGLPSAAACGVLANIEAESGFDPNALGDNGTSYGLCQWHDTASGSGRWTNLKNFCTSAELDPQTADGQLMFLNHELSTFFPGLLHQLQTVPNNSDGVSQAAYAWCSQFERPADMEEKAALRAERAVSTFWPKFGQPTVTEKE